MNFISAHKYACKSCLRNTAMIKPCNIHTVKHGTDDLLDIHNTNTYKWLIVNKDGYTCKLNTWELKHVRTSLWQGLVYQANEV